MSAESKVARLTSVPDDFLSSIPKSERQVYDMVVELLSRLEVKNGSYVISDKNLKIAAQISQELKSVLLSSDYTKSVTEFIREFDQQAVISNKLFEATFPSFKMTDLGKSVVDLSKRNAIDLLLNRASDADFIAPLRQQIEQSVINGASYKETVRSIRDFIEGTPEVDGALLKYSKTYAHDTFAIADRAYTSIVSDELDAEWFFYSGGVITSSRPFCVKRHNQYFYYKEIEKAALTDWAGKIPGTDSATIYSYAGGFSCRHSIIPVSMFAVPKEVIERNIASGNFTPSEKEAELLGV